MRTLRRENEGLSEDRRDAASEMGFVLCVRSRDLGQAGTPRFTVTTAILWT